MASKKRRILSALVGVITLGVGAVAWAMWPEVDDIPEQLPELSGEISIPDLSLDAQGSLPALRLGDFQGKTVFVMLEGRESMSGGEGKELHRAIHRWELPEGVVGFSVGEAPAGAMLMRDKIENEFLGPMQAEMKLPIYVDYGGKFREAFELPAGHLGFAILDPSGETVFRHAGDADEQTLAEIQDLLGASEPAPGPAAPAFALGELDNTACLGHACALIFLDAKVARSEIPGLEEGGFEGDMEASFEQIRQPSIRLAGMMARDWDTETRAAVAGVIVGEGEGWEVEDWPFVAAAPEARAAFELGDEAAMVLLDDQGRVMFSETGVIPFWKLMLAADLLGIEPKPRGKRKAD